MQYRWLFSTAKKKKKYICRRVAYMITHMFCFAELEFPGLCSIKDHFTYGLMLFTINNIAFSLRICQLLLCFFLLMLWTEFYHGRNPKKKKNDTGITIQLFRQPKQLVVQGSNLRSRMAIKVWGFVTCSIKKLKQQQRN